MFNFEAFTTPCELHIEAPNNSLANDAAQVIMAYAKGLEHRYGFFLKTSEVYALNQRSENTHRISDEFSGLIQMALFYTKMTQGVFDIGFKSIKPPTKYLNYAIISAWKKEMQEH